MCCPAGGLLSGQGHLVQARWLDVVACAVVVHKGTEAGERSGGSDFSDVGEVHAKLDKLLELRNRSCGSPEGW